MTNPIKATSTMSELLQIRHRVQREKPLIHCITNPISMRDCANTLLAVSARPIMAEYPPEAAQITAQARALAVNLGNISASRMEAMMISGRTALEKNIPCVIDAVGVACSSPPRFHPGVPPLRDQRQQLGAAGAGGSTQPRPGHRCGGTGPRDRRLIGRTHRHAGAACP